MMTLERITEENIDYASEIQAELFPEYSGRRNYEDSLAEDSRFEYFLVYEDGACAGITGIYSYPEYPESAWLGWFDIRENYRRKHLGSAVLKKFEEMAREKGFRFARLYTGAEDNDIAIAFYKANGYQPEPYCNAQDPVSLKYKALIFSKSLTSEPLIPWNNRNIDLSGQEEKGKQYGRENHAGNS